MKKIKFKLVFLISALLVVSLAGSGWLYWNQKQLKNSFEKASEEWAKERKKFINFLAESEKNVLKLEASLKNSEEQLAKSKSEKKLLEEKIKDLSGNLIKDRKTLVDLEKSLKEKEQLVLQMEEKIKKYEQTKEEEKKADLLQYEGMNIHELSRQFNKHIESWAKEKSVLEEKLIQLSSKLENPEFDNRKIINQIEEINKLLEDRLLKITLVRRQLEELMRQSKTLAMEKAFNTVSTVELPPIVVRKGDDIEFTENNQQVFPKEDEFQPDNKEGKILLVNQSENFVVINKGLKDNIKEGMSFDVFRGNSKIGEIKVMQAREKLSAADILQVVYGEIFMANDIVKPSN